MKFDKITIPADGERITWDGDKLQITDTAEMLKEYEAILGAKLLAGPESAYVFSKEDLKLAEVVVTGGSSIRGLKVDDIRLKERYGLGLLAVHRAVMCYWYKAKARTYEP